MNEEACLDSDKMKKKISEMTLPELIEEEKNEAEQLKVLKQKDKILQYQIKKFTAKDQTRMLCNHGRLLEHFLPPDQFTDGQMFLMLEELFADPKVPEMLEDFKKIQLDVSDMKNIFR